MSADAGHDAADVRARAVDAAMAVFERALKLYAPNRHVVEEAFDAAGAVYDAADEAHVDRLLAETMFAGMDIDRGVKIRLRMAAELSAGLVRALKTTLDTAGATNYLEQTIIDRATGDVYVVTAQRPGGKTPHELRREAEARAEMLAAELERYHRLHDLLDEAARDAGMVMSADAVKEMVGTEHLPVSWPAVHAGYIQRQLAAVNGQRLDRAPDPLEELARWLVSLDDPDPASVGQQERRRTGMKQIIERARQALGEKEG